MPKLNHDSIISGQFDGMDIRLPEYDINTVIANTRREPEWLHFGAGNIFRAFIARISQRLLNSGDASTGIIAADTFDGEIIDLIYKPHDDLSLMVDLRPDGNIKSEVIGSVAESLNLTPGGSDETRLRKIAVAPSLKIVSFTLTEKGYALYNMNGDMLPIVKEDIDAGPARPNHAMSRVCSLLFDRYNAGKDPIALVSMDNCSRNGEKLRTAVLEIASAWLKNGYVPEEFINWISDESQVSFPWTMIDKITPRPDKTVESFLIDKGIEDMSPLTTSKGTYIAPFVNAEVPEYLVVEDNFPNGRPPLEKAGVYMTDRNTVNLTERMKVTSCLNPLHTALSIFGCLLGYNRISDEMKDHDLSKLVNNLGYKEALKVVDNPGIIDPAAFLNEVINERLPNPFIPDMPQRIATDTSLKIPIRFGETIKSYIASEELNVTDLTYIPLTIAAWLRYLTGIDDNGKVMELSPDPMLKTLQELLSGLIWDNPDSIDINVDALLSNDIIFGVDLIKCGLAARIKSILSQMLEGEGSVRRTLNKYVSL